MQLRLGYFITHESYLTTKAKNQRRCPSSSSLAQMVVVRIHREAESKVFSTVYVALSCSLIPCLHPGGFVRHNLKESSFPESFWGTRLEV